MKPTKNRSLSFSNGGRSMKTHGRRRPALFALTAFAAMSALSTSGLAAWTEAPHAPLPIIGTLGGPVLATARVVPLYYAADPLAADLASYYAKLAKSTYLAKALAGYGVKSVTIAPAIALADPPPLSALDVDIAASIAAEIDAGTIPASDVNTMYQIIYPSTTQVLSGGLYGEAIPTCDPLSFEGYLASGTAVPIGIVPVCQGELPGETDIQTDTIASAGNIANVLTDPLSIDDPAYADPSWNGSGWEAVVGNMVGFLCQDPEGEWTTTPADLGFTVPEIWSNAAAAAGSNPCRSYSDRSAPYFNAAPEIQGGIAAYPGEIMKGILVPATGGSVTVPVRLFSDGPTRAWSLSAKERTDLDNQSPPPLPFRSIARRGRTETFAS